jgi:viroplasmin and RNaseH domain-containing protein
MPSKKNFYAVSVGRRIGVFSSWREAHASVDGFSGNCFKGFYTRAEAEAWLTNGRTPPATPAVIEPLSPPKPPSPTTPSKGRMAYMEDRIEELEDRVLQLEERVEQLEDAAKEIPTLIRAELVKLRQLF